MGAHSIDGHFVTDVMTELDTTPRPASEQIERIGAADLVVAILGPHGTEQADALGIVRDAVGKLAKHPKTVVLHSNGIAPVAAEQPEPKEDETFFVVSDHGLGEDLSVSPVQAMAAAYQSVFRASSKLGARACCVVASDLHTVTSRWITRLAE